MDLQHSFSSLLLPSPLFIVSLVLILITVLKITKPRKYPPPGPWKLPIIGNMHQLAGWPLTHRRLRDLANKHGPLMSLQLGQVPHIVISSPEVAKQVLKTHDIVFAHRPVFVSAKILLYNGQNIAFAPYGEYWRHMRKICATELLHAKRVRSFRAVREEHVSGLMTTISSYCSTTTTTRPRAINLSKMIFSLTCSIICKAAFGQIPKEKEESFREIADGVALVVGGLSIVDLFPSITILQVATGLRSKLQKLHQEADNILQNIISDIRKTSQNSSEVDHNAGALVHVLLNLQDQIDPPLTDNNIKAVILDMFLGGSETSSTTVEWAMSELMRHPEMMEKAQAEVRQVFDGEGKIVEDKVDELNYLKLIIKETLRLHAPIPLLVPRESREACEINGYHIAAKTRVIVNTWALGMDPNHWVEPERFNPERFVNSEIDYKGSNFEYLPFGGGRRICPGILFGIASVELPLANLLFHFDWKLPHGKKAESLDMAEAPGGAVRRKNALELIPVLRRRLLPVA